MTAKKPDLFSEPQEYMDRLVDNLSAGIIEQAAAQARQFGLKPKVSPHYLEVTVDRMNKKGVVDLKPFFKSSSMAKKKKKTGGWYMVIPIRRKVSGMSNAMYRQANAITIPVGNDTSTSINTLLYENRKSPQISSANYTPVSNNLTRVRNGKKSNYYAFRTVSDKSNPASWIMNRSKINDDNFSKTMLANMDRLFKQLVKRVGG